jgi:RHS repeat-associated protein
MTRRIPRAGTALVVALGLLTQTGSVVAHAAAHKSIWRPKVQRVKVLPRTPLRLPAPHRPLPRVPEGVRRAQWPSAGSASVAFGRTGQMMRAGRLPITLSSRQAQGAATVRLLGQAESHQLGVSGVVFTVSGGSGGPIGVGVNYASFANAIGGDFADRLHLVQFPSCALTSPAVARCQVQTPVKTAVRPGRQLLSATVRPRGTLVLAALSGASGSNGDFTVSSLSPQGTWSAGGQAGDFTWSYPIAVPPAAAGLAPDVALNYDSSSVDGRIASTNNQFGMIGEGFTLSTDNYIERTYADCADDPEGSVAKKYDSCWAGQVVTMNLNGRSTSLVLDDTSNKWYEQGDNGDRIQYLTGTAANTHNGTYDNGYWVVTTPDGTKYFFGKNRGPGWASGDPETNSAFTEPVYGPNKGDPCFDSSGFGSSSCTQAWRWNLDFVIDPNDNAMAYYYNTETNYYGANGGTTGVQYVRGGYLTRIDYGLRDESGSIYGTANAPDQVVFGADQRCIPNSSFACHASDFTARNASNWPDTPFDQQCASGDSCANHAPTFWSQMRIDSITTQYYNGTTYVPVDSYALGQGFSTQGDPELILNTITRTGYNAAGTQLPLDPVQLSYQLMNNRVPGFNSLPGMAHWRLTGIETETGEVVTVTYSSECAVSDIPSDPSKNTTQCYPVKWAQPGDQNTTLDYFNKYLVTQVEVQDNTAGDPAQLSTYHYIGNPAWHYDDNEVVKAKDRTWGQFRGFAQVSTLTGNPQNLTNGTADAQTLTKTRYFQGMDGDTNSSGGTTSGVTVTDSNGVTYPDSNALAGQQLETQTFNGNTGPELTDTVTVPSVLSVVATRARTGLPDQQASIVRTTTLTSSTDLASGGQLQKQTVTTYDSAGRPVLADQTGTAIPETCTQTSYADNPSAWIRDSVSEVISAAQACPSAPGNLTAANIVSDLRTYYDGSTTLGDAPTEGNPTQVSQATANSGGTLTFVTMQKQTYDGSGRILTSTDGLGNTTTTAYTPADGGPLTQIQTTNQLGQTSTQVIDPGRGSLLSATDEAGYLTSAKYDPLGRITAVWNPGRSQANLDAASVKYSYTEKQSEPLAVTTNTLVDTGTGTDYVPSVTIYDSLGQPRQTQTLAEGSTPSAPESVVTDQLRDSHGWVVQANKYVVSGSPSGQLVTAANSAINDRTLDTYDGADRVINQQDYNGLTLTDSFQTVYGGNQVTTIGFDPSGNPMGTPSGTLTNVLGQQTEQIQYTSAPTVTGSVVTGGGPRITTMSYDASGNQTQVKDPAGNTWTYGYDLENRQVKEVSPDAGTVVTSYDAAGNVAYTTNGAGVTVNYSYDGLNRKVAEHSGSTTQGSGPLLASWTWDTLKPGKLTSASSVVGGVTYKTGMTGYDAMGNPSGTFVTVPASQPLAGTYDTAYTYSTTGQLLTEIPAAGGGLSAELLSFSYDQFGNAQTESPVTAGATTPSYVSSAIWTPYDEISQIDLGSGSSQATQTYSYDPQTRNVTGIDLTDLMPDPQVDNIAYTYNADQQITEMADAQGGTGAQTEDQCYNYDDLSRLSEAWTSSNACASDPASAGKSTVQGPEPYWQSWTFDPEGDILTATSHATAGSGSGDTTATYHYSAGPNHAVSSITGANTVTGTLPTVSYSYNGAGDTTSLGGQTMTWSPTGELATAGPASYVYTADGKDLMESDTSGGTTTTTLYLPDEQLSTDGTTPSGVRYYTFAGHAIGEATASTAKNAPVNLYWVNGTAQGTLTAAVLSSNESAPVIRRASTPYGTVLTNASSPAWPDDRAFLGDPASPATDLVDVGARKYDPATGLFVSVDPVLNVANPQTMTGYTYAADDPVTDSDPSGALIIGGSSGGGAPTGAAPTPGDPCPYGCGPPPATNPWYGPTAAHISQDPYTAYHKPVVIKPIHPKIPPTIQPYNPFTCGHLGTECGVQGFVQMMHHLERSPTVVPDYWTLGAHLCFIECLGVSFTMDRFGRTYFGDSWGFGLGAGIGITPGFITSYKSQYHTPGYVENFIRGPAYTPLNAGVLFAGAAANHGNPTLNGSQNWSFEPSVAFAPEDFSVDVGGARMWSNTFGPMVFNGPTPKTTNSYACAHLSECP